MPPLKQNVSVSHTSLTRSCQVLGGDQHLSVPVAVCICGKDVERRFHVVFTHQEFNKRETTGG